MDSYGWNRWTDDDHRLRPLQRRTDGSDTAARTERRTRLTAPNTTPIGAAAADGIFINRSDAAPRVAISSFSLAPDAHTESLKKSTVGCLAGTRSRDQRAAGMGNNRATKYRSSIGGRHHSLKFEIFQDPDSGLLVECCRMFAAYRYAGNARARLRDSHPGTRAIHTT